MHRFRTLLSLLTTGVAASGCVVIPLGDLLKGPALTEQVLVQGGSFWSDDKIAVIDVDGILTGSESSSLLVSQENSVAELKARLSWARQDPDLRAVVLRITSPGGEVTACDVMYHELQRFKKQKGVPVLASIGDQGASGGYYLAMAADTIFANPTAIVGSIGVILQHFDLSGLLGKIGVAVDPIKSSEQKDLSSIFRPITPAEKTVLQKLVDDMYQRFVEVVAAGRPQLTRETVLSLADGRVVSGVEAARLGLVDRTGYLTDAIEEAQRRAGVERPTIVRYTRVARSGANIYSASGVEPTASRGVHLSLDVPTLASPRLLYLWRPGF